MQCEETHFFLLFSVVLMYSFAYILRIHLLEAALFTQYHHHQGHRLERKHHSLDDKDDVEDAH